MGEIGSGDGSSYPGALDANNYTEVNSPAAGKTRARAEVVNDLASAVIAVQTELGTEPAGSLTDVKTFLQTEHGADGTHAISDFTNSTHDHADAAGGGDTLTSPTLTTPTIASFVNATHDHSNAAGGSYTLGQEVQRQTSFTATSTTGTTLMVADDTIPQNDEGDQYLSCAITPTSATNKVVIDVFLIGSHSVAAHIMGALFQDSTVNALAGVISSRGSNNLTELHLHHEMAAGTTDETTFKVRAGGSAAGTFTFNGTGGSRILGGTLYSGIVIREIQQ